MTKHGIISLGAAYLFIAITITRWSSSTRLPFQLLALTEPNHIGSQSNQKNICLHHENGIEFDSKLAGNVDSCFIQSFIGSFDSNLFHSIGSCFCC